MDNNVPDNIVIIRSQTSPCAMNSRVMKLTLGHNPEHLRPEPIQKKTFLKLVVP